jgi:hypothetical protein
MIVLKSQLCFIDNLLLKWSDNILHLTVALDIWVLFSFPERDRNGEPQESENRGKVKIKFENCLILWFWRRLDPNI